MSKEAIKLALEALKKMYAEGFEGTCGDAIKALEEALAKQEQGEPVAIIHRNEYNEYRLEPHDSFDIKSIPFNVDVPLYATPQQRTWVGLTDWEISALIRETHNTGSFVRAIEAKLKEKNGYVEEKNT
jgi:hypothetical protein